MAADSSSPAPEQAPVAPQGPLLVLQRAYVKDVSLEIPSSPDMLFNQAPVHFDINVAFNTQELPRPSLYEVGLKATLTGKAGDKTLFLLEMEQAGVFEVRNLDAVGMSHALEVACPTLLLPYLRAHLADMLLRATLPVMHLPDVNWAAIWQDKHAAMLAQQGAARIH